MEERHKIGLVGEMYVMYKLATLGISSIKAPMRFGYDILAEGDTRIEVKTSMLREQPIVSDGREYNYSGWSFSNHKKNGKSIGNKLVRMETFSIDRPCDFFVFVCLDEQLDVVKCYVVPKSFVGTRRMFKVRKAQKTFLEPYEEKWEFPYKR